MIESKLRAANSSVIYASGGIESKAGGYKYHTFTSSGAFLVTKDTSAVECLIVAGGGGAGAGHGG